MTIFKLKTITHNMLQHRVAKCMQHVAPNNVAICCVGMLRSFGRGLKVKVLCGSPYLLLLSLELFEN